MKADSRALILLCRPGFGKECLAEITDAAGGLGHYGWSRLEPDSGFVRFETEQAAALYPKLSGLVFTRDAWPVPKKKRRQAWQALRKRFVEAEGLCLSACHLYFDREGITLFPEPSA